MAADNSSMATKSMGELAHPYVPTPPQPAVNVEFGEPSKERTCCSLLNVGPGCIVAELVSGLILIAVGVVGVTQLAPLLHEEIKNDFIVTGPGSTGYKDFLNMSGKVPIRFTNYFFNISNVDDVLNHGAQPKLTQMGPYTYDVAVWKPEEWIYWQANGTVRYVEGQSFVFLPEESVGLESDLVYTVNIGLLGALKEIAALNGTAEERQILWDVIKDLLLSPSATYFQKRSVGDFLNGYVDPFLNRIHSIIASVNPFIAIQPQRRHPTAPEFLSEVYTGGLASTSQPAPPPHAYMSATMWRGHQPLSFWGSQYANMINGTDGTVYPPGLTSTQDLYVFIDSLYRSFHLVCHGTRIIRDTNVLHWRLDPKLLLSPAEYPPARDFYQTVAGFLPTPPSLHLPYFFSQPYFLAADNSSVNVTLPGPADPTIHETFIDIEPLTGVLFNVSKRVQVNAQIGEIVIDAAHGPVAITKGVPGAVLPIAWFDQHMLIPEAFAEEIRDRVFLVKNGAHAGFIVAMALGSLLLLLAASSTARRLRRAPQRSAPSPS